jgi:hypothetical protein
MFAGSTPALQSQVSREISGLYNGDLIMGKFRNAASRGWCSAGANVSNYSVGGGSITSSAPRAKSKRRAKRRSKANPKDQAR